MADSQTLAFLIFTDEGTLVRYSRGALDLTGYGAAQVASLSEWCKALFKEPENRRIAWGSIEKYLLNRDLPADIGKFFLPFQTMNGTTKVGRFTVVRIGKVGWRKNQILVTIVESDPLAQESSVPARSREDGPVGKALDAVRGAISGLQEVSHESRDRALAIAMGLQQSRAESPQPWDALFQTAFVLERIQGYLKDIEQAAAVLERTLQSRTWESDPDRPLSRTPLGSIVALPLGLDLHKLERFWILSTLHAAKGNRGRCAAQLGLATATVRRRLGVYQKEGFPVPPIARTDRKTGAQRTVPFERRPESEPGSSRRDPVHGGCG
jgi:hypothetical protein